MKTKNLLILPLFILLSQIRVNAQSADSIRIKIKQVESDILPMMYVDGDKLMTLEQRMAFYKVKGLSIAVIHNYKIEWAKGYGFANDSLKIPVTAHTLFQAGSISKSLNSVGVLKLMQEKKIDLYSDINNYLISWKFPYDSLSKGKKINMANLLSHTAGLSVHGFGGYTVNDPVPSVIQVLNGEKPANSPAVRSMYAPGLKYEYSGGGVTISQLIVMDITHQPYAQYMYNNVLKPLNMTESTYEQPPVNVKPQILAVAYDGDKAIKGQHHIYPEQAAAGLWTNPTDLSKYIIETQLAYEGKSHKVLDQKSTQIRLTPYIDKIAALGCFIYDVDGVKYFSHEGEDAGFSAIYYGSVQGGNGVVVMVNSYNNTLMKEVVNSVAQVYHFKGLNTSSAKKIIAVPDSVLQTYTGDYELEPGFILTISREGSQLFGKAGKQTKLPIYPEAKNKFFSIMANAEVEFVKNDQGVISELILYQGGEHPAKRIK
ncbi:serine hydrolase [Mucilaginibacter sp. E4BP6]|uniref:serine hydrolase n=1 Tax=Mucilaginibacter sp. E4BP6 TaxID=2723089 RepID=UPI0015CDFC4C|nr:serine hydrolase [Mucilaginibacter sp. E4BP6]NYE68356.1 CubicO group peptidase (beta-lactamase class C family) [Mucilaginibacter sp. E4BP6]